MPPSKYSRDEIQKNMFLPLMTKALMGCLGGIRQNYSLFASDEIFLPLTQSSFLLEGLREGVRSIII